MTIEIKVPTLPESVADATIAKWYKKPGDRVSRDENLVDLETDKVMLEVPAPADGVLESIAKSEGEVVEANVIIGVIKEGAGKEQAKSDDKAGTDQSETSKQEKSAAAELSPAVRRLVAEHDINVNEVAGSGKQGRITKEDVEKHIADKANVAKKPEPVVSSRVETAADGRQEKRVPMSRLRAKIAERLLEAKQSTAMLTSFNEVNMQPVMDLRAKYKDKFVETHGTKLGFMSFFVKAASEALKRFPAVNAAIDGKDIVYHGFYDIGIAVSTDRGLVVPILRDADQMSMADVEKQIVEYAKRARDGKLTIEEMTGGTFTITNGGIFGSMLSTPILNPPQSAILGMHNIVNRPVAEGDQVVIRPIMYLALSYDHRIIDGRDSVQFLVTIKQLLEDPARLLLEL